MSQEKQNDGINVATVLNELDEAYKSFIDLWMSEEDSQKKSTLLIKYKYSQLDL